jgi:hypothetical protein
LAGIPSSASAPFKILTHPGECNGSVIVHDPDVTGDEDCLACEAVNMPIQKLDRYIHPLVYRIAGKPSSVIFKAPGPG